MGRKRKEGQSRNFEKCSRKGAGRERSSNKKYGQENKLYSLLQFIKFKGKKTVSKTEQMFHENTENKRKIACNE